MSSVMSVAEDDIDAWYSDIVAKTLKAKKEELSRAKTRFQLAVALMDSVRMDVRDARKDVKKWKKKAAVGRIHCPRLKARMCVSASALMSVSAPKGEDSDEDSSQSTSSSEVVAAQRRLVASPTSSSSSLSMNSNSSGRSQEDVEAPTGGPTAEEDAQWMMELLESLK